MNATMPSTARTRHGLAIIATIIIMLASAIYFSPPVQLLLNPGRQGCDRALLSSHPSPDLVRVAMVQEDICSDGYFVTMPSYSVSLVRQNRMNDYQLRGHFDHLDHKDTTIATISGAGSGAVPLLSWRSDAELRMSVPRGARIGVMETVLDGVSISMRVYGDDGIEF